MVFGLLRNTGLGTSNRIHGKLQPLAKNDSLDEQLRKYKNLLAGKHEPGEKKIPASPPLKNSPVVQLENTNCQLTSRQLEADPHVPPIFKQSIKRLYNPVGQSMSRKTP